MEIIEVIREQEADDALLLREEFTTMANFVNIGKRIVNLDKAQTVHYNPQGGLNYDRPCIEIDFGGAENSISIFNEYEPDAFKQLRTWMDAQPALLSEQRHYVPPDEPTHPPNCACPWCSEG